MKKKALWVSLSVIILIIVAIPFGFFIEFKERVSCDAT
jgi:hypothetical protein